MAKSKQNEIGAQAVEISGVIELTPAVARSLVEQAADSNILTDTLLTKLQGIENAATADLTGSEIVTLLDTALGSTAWRTGGGASLSLGKAFMKDGGGATTSVMYAGDITTANLPTIVKNGTGEVTVTVPVGNTAPFSFDIPSEYIGITSETVIVNIQFDASVPFYQSEITMKTMAIDVYSRETESSGGADYKIVGNNPSESILSYTSPGRITLRREAIPVTKFMVSIYSK